VGVSRDRPFFRVPSIISGTGKATDFKFGQYIHSVHPNKSPRKIFWRKGSVGVSRDYPNFLCTPYIIAVTGKATGFKFGQHIQRVNPDKSPLKISEKRERGRIQGLANFFGYPILSQERVKLRNSNFACTFIGAIGTKAH